MSGMAIAGSTVAGSCLEFLLPVALLSPFTTNIGSPIMPALPSAGRAIVKNVISADTVVLRGKPVNGPPPERIISFANLVAPRLGTAKDPEKEEAFAFEAREFLRKLLVGKEVAFKVEYTTTTNQRDFGVLTLPPGGGVDGETNVTRLLIKEGWAKVKQPDGKRQASEEQIALTELEQSAQAAKKGLWAETAPARNAKYNLDGEPRAFLDKYKGKPIDAILEQVRDGSTYRVCLLLPEGNARQYVTLSVSGVKAPIYRKDVPGVEDLVEPYAEEARYFVEARLLQRDIKVILEGVSNNNFVGSVQFPLGNIAEALLAEGLAKVVDWTLTIVTGGPVKLRAAESKAKERRLRLWKDYVAKQAKSSDSAFDAVVTKIVTADTILVQNLKTGVEKKLTLSSIRSPKLKEAREAGYNVEAKEFLRSRLIGKQVHVTLDYVKPPAEGYEERECATIKVGDVNIAEALVSKGLAGVVRYRKDDDNRASDYDALLVAESRAQEGQKGMHSPKEPPVHRIADASENANKARGFFSYLQRAGNIPAVVEYVATGSRFKVYVPSQNCKLTLVLGGIRAPRVGRTPQEKSEPFGPEALDFVNKRALQRDVEISIEGMDKVGGFIGALFLLPSTKDHFGTSKKENLASLLLEQGLATVHEYSANQTTYARELFEAEKKAKDARKGIWSIQDPNAVDTTVEVVSKEDEVLPKETKEAIVSEIAGGGRIYLQFVGEELNKLERLMADFARKHSGSQPIAPFTPKAGEYCSAKFTADENWYRARIKKVNPDKTYQVLYIDYGNSETLPASRLRALDSEFSLTTLRAQATEAALAYIKVPDLESDYGAEVFEYLRDLTENKTLKVRVVGRVPSAVGGGQALNVLLYDPKVSGDVSVNQTILQDGYATVAKAYARTRARISGTPKAGTVMALVAKFLEAQEEARKGRLNMWQYGDITDDDDQL
ncbi:nuclease domain-containing protein [Quaeritorhiza haematococci]|nr:nuclease domain-containing protein [Quaeritorhiza haematococci]